MIMRQRNRKWDIKMHCAGYLCAIVIAFCLVYGYGFHNELSDPLTNTWLFVLFVTAAAGLGILFSVLMEMQRTGQQREARGRQREPETAHQRVVRNLITPLVLIAGWVPYWLAAYPGFFTYDASNVFVQHFYGLQYSTHHPLLHTVLIGDVVKIVVKLFPENYNLGIAVLSWLEMLTGAAVFTYMLDFVRQISNRVVYAAGMLYLALFPVIGLFASCSTKDTFSAFWVILCAVKIVKLRREEMAGHKIRIRSYAALVIGLILMLLYRKNILIAYFLFAPFLVWLVKGHRRKWTLLLAGALAGYFLCNTCLELRFQPERGGLEEALCVPLQQLGKTYESEGEAMFTAEEREIFYRIHPDSLSVYHDLNADFVKGNMNEEELRNNFGTFIKMWLRIGLHHPVRYAEAFLKNTYQAWYPFCNITGYMERADTTYTYFKCDVEAPGELDSKLPGFYDFLWRLSRETSLYEIPVAGILFSSAFYLMVLVYILFYGIYARDRNGMIFALFILAVTFTAMCGPLVLPRYYIYLYYAFPMMLGLLFRKKQEEGYDL